LWALIENDHLNDKSNYPKEKGVCQEVGSGNLTPHLAEEFVHGAAKLHVGTHKKPRPQKKNELGNNLLTNYALKKGKVIVTWAINSPSKWAINHNSTM
jgi:hypothetical protein